MTRCLKCMRMIPDGMDVCPFCGDILTDSLKEQICKPVMWALALKYFEQKGAFAKILLFHLP